MKIETGIAATSHVDLIGDIISCEALESMAKQINDQYIPLLYNHDFNQHIGVIFAAKVGRLLDGEFALYVKFGLFENDFERKQFELRQQNTAIETKGLIARIKDFSIKIYSNDHPPAHFHAISSQQKNLDVKFSIETLDYISHKGGKIKQKDIKLIRNYFKSHSRELLKLRAEYNRLSNHS